jgi:tetratricopeptide (TPR) repeat protein
MANLEAALGKLEWESRPLTASWRLRRAAAIARASSQTRHAAVPDYERGLATASPPDRPGALELIGLLMLHGEDYVLAKKYLSEAEAAGRNVDRELGRALLRTGDLDGARTRLRRALASDAKDWNVLSDIGVLEYQAGNYEDAVANLTRSLELDPYRPEIERSLGRAHEKAGRTGRGYYHFAKASELERSDAQAHTYYKKALEALDPNDPLRNKVSDKLKGVSDASGAAQSKPFLRRDGRHRHYRMGGDASDPKR